MLIACWSVKGGSGTSVTAATLALVLARSSGDAVLVDCAGDAPAVLGVPSPHGGGVVAWAASEASRDSLWGLAVDAAPGLTLLPAGPSGPADAAAGERLAAALDDRRPVVVDCGSAGAPFGMAVAGVATVSLLVIRPCYLALRRALDAPLRPSSVVLVDEPGRSLRPADVEDVLGVPVRAVIPCEPRIARCVDAGLLAARLPRSLAVAVRRAA